MSFKISSYRDIKTYLQKYKHKIYKGAVKIFNGFYYIDKIFYRNTTLFVCILKIQMDFLYFVILILYMTYK